MIHKKGIGENSMSTDLYIEAFEKMPGEDEKLFYKFWSYDRVNVHSYEIDVDSYSNVLMPMFNEIFERKKEEGLYNDCRYAYEYVICLSFEEAVKIADVIYEELKKETDLPLSLYSPGSFVEIIYRCKSDIKEKEKLFDNYWITMYLC